MARTPVPTHWFNVNAAIPELYEPYVDPETNDPVTDQALEELFAPELVAQEVNRADTWLPIPEEVLRRLSTWRPTPLLRARGLEAALDTRCRILYKYEGASPIGSHKANSGVAQAYFTKRSGRDRVYAETGAGQWGSAISLGSAFNGLGCSVFMVGSSFDSKPSRRILMETFGSTVERSPTEHTDAGRSERARTPDSTGGLGLAIAEAVEATKADPAASYALGSAFGFVCLHQTIIGQELKDQLVDAGVEADVLISCIGGGSSFGGVIFPFLTDPPGRRPELIAAESNAVPKVTRGEFTYDHGDSSGLTPLIKMYTLGHKFAPPSIHSGGLRYHGLAPQVSKLINLGMGRAEAYAQLEIFDAATLFARTEGIVPAPEAAHGIAAACHYATKHRDEERTVVFCLTGHGFFDLPAYQTYLTGNMEDSDTPDDLIEKSLSGLSRVSGTRPTSLASGRDTAFAGWQRRHAGARTSPPRRGDRDSPAARAGATSPLGRVSRADGDRAASAADSTVTDLTGAQVVTERTLGGCAPDTTVIVVQPGAVLTPSARSELRRRGIAVRNNER